MLAWGISSKYRFTINKRVLYETSTFPIDLFMLLYMLMLALRGLMCGSDTARYAVLYPIYGDMSYAKIITGYDFERGFMLLAKFVYQHSRDFQVFLCVTAVICVLPLWYFYKKESENCPLTIALFLAVAPFMMYFSGIRQSIAMSIGILCWYAAKNKKPFLFIVSVLVAIQFHTSAFILAVLYPLYGAKITKNWLFVVVPLMAAVFLFRVPIFNFLLRFLWEEYEITAETGASTTLMLLIIFAVYSYLIPDDTKLERDVIAMRNILLLSIVIQFFALLHPLSMRMNYYFLLFVPILIPKIAARCKMRYHQVSKLSVVVMTAYFLYYFVNKMVKDIDSLNIFPHIPFWQN